MKWSDINLNQGIIQIHDKAKRGKFRVVNMTKEVKAMLSCVPKRLRCDYVFYNKDGKPFVDLKKGFKTALKKAGIRSIRFHDLRHTFASHSVMNGVDLITLKEALGHSSLAMVERYAHLASSYKQDLINKLDFSDKDHRNTPKIANS